MTLVLHPLLGRPGHARVWVGNWNRVDPPVLAWQRDGVPVQAAAIRAVSSARPPGMVADDQPRAFTGVYEFAVDDASGVEIEVSNAEGERASAWTWAPPDSPGETFNVLMVSCFHRDEESAALRGVASRLRGLPVGQRPDLTLLMGDQVYLDLPTLKDFHNDRAWLAAKFERDYTRNWGPDSGFHDLLHLAPSVAAPDDHEFWNNFPHASPFIGNSHSESGRANWRAAAGALYAAFQMREPDALLGMPARFDVGDLSFCVMDTRTHRDEDRRFVQSAAARQAFTDWSASLYAGPRRRIGVAVTGQLLTTREAGGLRGRVADWELPNYADHAPMRQRFGEVLGAGGTLVWLTGDVHWGRVMRASGPAGHNQLYEVVASPATLLTTTGKDTLSRLGGWLGGLFGEADPWPRHNDAEDAPTSVSLAGRRYLRNYQHLQKGDHVAMLNFRGQPRPSLQVSYWPIRRNAGRVDVPRFLLRT